MMKTTHYTLTVREDKMAGVSTAGRGGRVIDLEEWKAAHSKAAPLPESPVDYEAARRPASPRRGFLHYALQGAELLATLCVIAVLAALALRILAW